jgi:hypothetical protein
MITSEIITYWVQTVDDDGGISNSPHMVPMQPGDTWTDATGQETVAGSPNLVVLSVRCGAATLAAMEADPDIFVLWSVADEA